MRGGPHRLLWLVMAASLAGCSSPNPVLYTIVPLPGQVEEGAPRVIVLRQVAIARYLDRQEIVRSSENYRLRVMENDWWGEPLAAMLSRVLVDELSRRLPQSTVITDTGAVSAPAAATLTLDLERLDEDAAGNLVLEAQAGVHFAGHKEPLLRRFHFLVTPPAADAAGEVAAISTAVARLADGIAPLLATGTAGR